MRIYALPLKFCSLTMFKVYMPNPAYDRPCSGDRKKAKFGHFLIVVSTLDAQL
jgi:hypothetical protein